MSAKEKQHFYSNKQYKIDFSKYYSDDTRKNIKIDILKSDLDKGFYCFVKEILKGLYKQMILTILLNNLSL